MSDEIDWEKLCDEINNATDEDHKERKSNYEKKTLEEKIKHHETLLKIFNSMQFFDPKICKNTKKFIQDEKAELEKQVIKDKLESI